MAEKRKRDGAESSRGAPGKKQRKGFSVGPANLPDGTYKRKTQKIKNALIERAQIKKDYAKLRKKGHVPDEPEQIPIPASLQQEQDEAPQEANDADQGDRNEPHPDRQTLIDQGPADDPEPEAIDRNERRPRQRKPKALPFKREHQDAQKRKAEAEERRLAREEAQRQRQQKIEERERFRRAMAKARTGGPNGQRKLGRESKVLLEKVKRMVNND